MSLDAVQSDSGCRLVEFGLHEDDQGGTRVVSVQGDVDIFTAPLLDACIQRNISAGSKEIALVLDDCSYFDSEGIKVLVKALRAMSGSGQLLICGARGAVRRVFEVSGLETIFKLLPSVNDLLDRSALFLIAIAAYVVCLLGCPRVD